MPFPLHVTSHLRAATGSRSTVRLLCAGAAASVALTPLAPLDAVASGDAGPGGALSASAPERAGGTRAPAGAEYSLWGSTAGRAAEAGTMRTFGTRFRVSRTGEATAIRLFRAPGDHGKHAGRLYDRRGKVLAKVTFGAADAGWQSADLKSPVVLRKGRTYVVAHSSRSGLHAVGGSVPSRVGSLKASAGLVARKGMPRKVVRTPQLVDVVYHPRVGPWPDAGNTGAPSETGLPTYTGPCTITQDGTVIDAQLVPCSLEIRAAGVVVQDSVVHGTIDSGESAESGWSFTLLRSTLDVSPDGVALETGVGSVNFKVIRSEIRGGNRGINCFVRCTVRGSWVHGQDTDSSGTAHESGIRMGERSKIIDNTIACDAPDVPPDAGCSAPLTGYGDFAPVRRNVIDGNLFVATTGGTCAYGGSSGGKPYSDGAGGIVFANNVFQRGDNGNCGYYAPVLDFDLAGPGNQWVGNTWADGGKVEP